MRIQHSYGLFNCESSFHYSHRRAECAEEKDKDDIIEIIHRCLCCAQDIEQKITDNWITEPVKVKWREEISFQRCYKSEYANSRLWISIKTHHLHSKIHRIRWIYYGSHISFPRFTVVSSSSHPTLYPTEAKHIYFDRRHGFEFPHTHLLRC